MSDSTTYSTPLLGTAIAESYTPRPHKIDTKLDVEYDIARRERVVTVSSSRPGNYMVTAIRVDSELPEEVIRQLAHILGRYTSNVLAE